MTFTPTGVPEKRESLTVYIDVKDENVTLSAPDGRSFHLGGLRITFVDGALDSVLASCTALVPEADGWHVELFVEVLENRADRHEVDTLPEWVQRAVASVDSLPDVIAHKRGTPRMIALPATGKQLAADLIASRTANIAYAARNGTTPTEVTTSLVRMMDEPELSRFYS